MAAEQPIPIFTNLSDLFGTLGTALNHAERWNNLVEEFEKRFGRKPAYVARAPGRVNLIGDHIDYCLFGVFPAAVEQDILIACAPQTGQAAPGSVVADNLHQNYTRQTFTPRRSMFKMGVALEEEPSDSQVHAEQWHLGIDTSQLRWESYVKAGYYGVLNHYYPKRSSGLPVPVDLLVTGTVPAGSGLSSSAAMVVASTLAFLAVNGKLEGEDKLNKGQLVELAVENEKRVGVNSGGMDQAASVTSLPQHAVYISFFPKLSAKPVKLPKKAAFVCANSLVVADKVVSAKWHYNLRVVESLVGARILGNKLDVKVGPKERVTYREVIGRFVGEAPEGLDEGALKNALEQALEHVDCLKGSDERGATLEEMIAMSGLSKEDFHEVYLSWVEVEATHFKLFQRGRHILRESLRVLEYLEICQTGEDSEESLRKLGELMDISHESCAKDCENSCPELDELVKLANESGAYGSRVTGAGWGGCIVSLVAESEVDSFIAKMKAGYKPFSTLDDEALREVLFATKPSTGACVYKL